MLLALILFTLYHFIQYKKLKKIYQDEHLKLYKIKVAHSLYPIVAKTDTKRYKKAQSLINAVGWNVSVEMFFIYKFILFIMSFILIVNVVVTNITNNVEDITKDCNYKRIMIEDSIKVTPESINKEVAMYNYVKNALKEKKISIKILSNIGGDNTIHDFVVDTLNNSNFRTDEDINIVAKRMLNKFIAISFLENDYLVYLFILLICSIFYLLPDYMAFIKYKLLEDKKDWEVLNFTYVCSIFGRLPPYKIENVLSNMLVVADTNKYIIKELLEGVKNGKGEKSFEEALSKIDDRDSEFYEILDTMKLALSIGFPKVIDSIDSLSNDMVKWLEVKNIKRRKSKKIIALIPVAIMVLLGALYFSYGIYSISNPMNFFK